MKSRLRPNIIRRGDAAIVGDRGSGAPGVIRASAVRMIASSRGTVGRVFLVGVDQHDIVVHPRSRPAPRSPFPCHDDREVLVHDQHAPEHAPRWTGPRPSQNEGPRCRTSFRTADDRDDEASAPARPLRKAVIKGIPGSSAWFFLGRLSIASLDGKAGRGSLSSQRVSFGDGGSVGVVTVTVRAGCRPRAGARIPARSDVPSPPLGGLNQLIPFRPVWPRVSHRPGPRGPGTRSMDIRRRVSGPR